MAEFHSLKSLQDDQAPEEWKAWNQLAEKTASNAVQAKMPTLDHLSRADYRMVYEPAEDTYLLIDALLHEFENGVFDKPARSKSTPTTTTDDFVVLEIGCGTGVPTVWFRKEWRKRYPDRRLRTLVTDINPHALQVALRTDDFNNNSNTNTDDNQPLLGPLETVHCDLATTLLEEFDTSIDVVIFNPPYVVTPDKEVVDFSQITEEKSNSTDQEEEEDDAIIAAAWAGGIRGRRVVDRALPQIQHLLRGVAYLVTVDDNQPWEMAHICTTVHQMNMQPLLRRRAHNEYLTIQKLTPMCAS